MSYSIILFDGVCNLCNSFVNFVIDHDDSVKYKFASLQSEFGQKLLKREGMPLDNFGTMLLFQEEKIYTRSTAALKILKTLNSYWAALYVFIVVPAWIRDGIYSFIAKRRMFFQNNSSCRIPSPELVERFLN